MIKLAILGLLKEQPLHGYELKKRLGDVLGPLSRVSFGSLYPALGKLEEDGAVRAVETPEPAGEVAIPMTGSLAGEAAAFRARRRSRPSGRGRRGKKVYAITDDGQRLFEELLSSPIDPDDDRSFSLRLAFGRYLAPDARLRLLQRRRAQLVERVERARQATRQASRLDSWTRSLVEHDTEAAERDLSWLDRLIAAEQRPGAPDSPDADPQNSDSPISHPEGAVS